MRLLSLSTFGLAFVCALYVHAQHDPLQPYRGAVGKTLSDTKQSFPERTVAAKGMYHFPHYRPARSKMSVLENAGLRDDAEVFRSLEKTGCHHSRWEHRNIVHASSEKVHVDTQFSRFNSKDNKPGVYESLYILTREMAAGV